jgi:vitamin B12 transporter
VGREYNNICEETGIVNVKLRYLLLTFFLIMAPYVCHAAEGGAFAASAGATASGEPQGHSKEVVNDLLLFWEEKDLYVESPTRNVKPISKAAENITVITAKDIEDMNAHTVAEVLDRVTGVFVDFPGHDFGSASFLSIEGSDSAGRQVLVLLDGIPWNFLSSGTAETNSIPVRIIQRIEVIKGPASSSWGSSLGGVVNIITKDTGNSYVPSGSLNASYGQKQTQDYTAEVAGKVGSLGYYLYAGNQYTDGLRDGRSFNNNSLYSKFSFPISSGVKIGATVGYSEPHLGSIDIPSSDIASNSRIRAFWATTSLDIDITKELRLSAELYDFEQKFAQTNNALGLGDLGNAGELFLNADYDEQTTGGSAKLIWNHGIHTAVLGTDISHGSLTQTLDAGQFLQSQDVPSSSSASPDEDKWAVFANDTMSLGRFSVTPGIRYDHNSISGSFVSPSIGATYKLTEHAILRASVARGFSTPPLSWTSGGALFLDPNPSLEPEKVWSYQVGIESSLSRYLWAKITLFYHDVSDALERVPLAAGPPTFNDLILNDGNVRRKGCELETETAPFHNISLKAGFAYVNSDSASDVEKKNIYEYNLGMKYDDRKSFMGQLFGHYVWWDLNSASMAKYNDFLWDLDLRKRVYTRERTSVDVFLAVHNIFDGSQYTFGDTKNPKRWIEGGMTVSF